MKISDLYEDIESKNKETYEKWKKLINMSAAQVESYKASQTSKAKKDSTQYPGLKPRVAAKAGISSGVQSAEWVIKLKSTPVKEWTPLMWKWANKQVSFVSRMKGAAGPLKDENGDDTRKTMSLKIWGHNPNR